MEGVEQLVSGEGPSGFGLPAMLQQYVEHGGCLFKVCLCPVLEFQASKLYLDPVCCVLQRMAKREILKLKVLDSIAPSS